MRIGIALGLLFWLLLWNIAYACESHFYFEAGAGWVRNDSDIIETPIARMLFGYERDGWSVELDHISSIPDKDDHGIETLWINKRIYIH